MKKLLMTVAAVLAALNMYGQGTVTFQNSTTARVFIDAVGGTAAGAGYQVGLYYAADGITDESMFTQLGAAANVTSGIYAGGNRTAPTTTPGGFGMFQVRGWTTAYASSYEQGKDITIAANKVGKSSIIRVDTGDPTTVPPGTPTLLSAAGIQAFALTTPVPEPSAIALGLVGAGALLMLRRRK